jgi:hypothetical protein
MDMIPEERRTDADTYTDAARVLIDRRIGGETWSEAITESAAVEIADREDRGGVPDTFVIMRISVGRA